MYIIAGGKNKCLLWLVSTPFLVSFRSDLVLWKTVTSKNHSRTESQNEQNVTPAPHVYTTGAENCTSLYDRFALTAAESYLHSTPKEPTFSITSLVF